MAQLRELQARVSAERRQLEVQLDRANESRTRAAGALEQDRAQEKIKLLQYQLGQTRNLLIYVLLHIEDRQMRRSDSHPRVIITPGPPRATPKTGQ